MNRRHFWTWNCSTSQARLIFLFLLWFQRRSGHDHWLSINYESCNGAWLFQRAASRLNYPPPRGGKTFWFFRRLSNTHSDFNVSLSGAASAWSANLIRSEKITGQDPRPRRATNNEFRCSEARRPFEYSALDLTSKIDTAKLCTPLVINAL